MSATPDDVPDREPQYGELVIVQAGRFEGWVGLYDNDEGSRAIVFPMYPMHAPDCVRVKHNNLRLLTETERHADSERAKAPNAFVAAITVANVLRHPNATVSEGRLDMVAEVTGTPRREPSMQRLLSALRPFAEIARIVRSGVPVDLMLAPFEEALRILEFYEPPIAPAVGQSAAPPPAAPAVPMVFTPGLPRGKS